MTSLGGFDILDTRSDDGVVSIHAARRAGDASARPARLRRYRAPLCWRGLPRAAIERRAFLETATRQKLLARMAPESWAAIVGEGRDDAPDHPPGAFIVVDHPPTSLEDLVRGRIALTANDLRALVSGVVSALRATHGADHLPHGALKPNTVLLGAGDTFAGRSIRLTDPAPPLDAKTELDVDRVALGELIVRLVEHQPSWAALRWPIQSSRAWKRLGRSGEQWRELVNRLLDPSAAERGNALTFDDIAANLPIEPRDLRKPLGVLAAAAVIAVIAGGIYWQFYYDRALDDAGQAEMRLVLREMYEEYPTWFGPFREGIGTEGGDPFIAFRAQTALHEHVEFFKRQIIEPIHTVEKRSDFSLDPRRYVPEANRTFTAERILNEWLPTADLSSVGERRLENLKAARQTIEYTKEQLAKWPLRLLFEEAADDLRELGWSAVAEDAERLAAGPMQHDSPEVFTRVRDLLSAHESLSQVRRLTARMNAVTEAAEARGARVPGEFRDWLYEHVGAAVTLDTAAERLTARESIMGRMERWLVHESARLDWEGFDEEIGLARSIESSSHEAFEAWAARLGDFERLATDPRATINLAQWTVDVTQPISGIRQLGADSEADQLTEGRARLQTEATELMALRAIEKNRATIEARTSTLTRRLNDFRLHAGETFDRINQPPAQYLAELRALTFTSPILSERWSARLREERLEAQLGDPPTYGRFRRTTEALRAAFTVLARDHFQFAASLPSATDGWRPEAITGVITARRETGLGRVASEMTRMSDARGGGTAMIPGMGAVTTLETPDIAELLTREEAAFAQWMTLAVAFGEDVRRAEQLLNTGHLPDERDTAGDTPAGILSGWSTGDSTRRELALDFVPSVESFNQRLSDARAVLAENDAAALAQWIERHAIETRPEIWRATWRRLVERDFTALPRELSFDANVLRALSAWAASAPLSEARRGALRSQLEEEAPGRWIAHAETLHRAEAMEAIMAARNEFHVHDDRLPEWLRWNARLAALRSAMIELGEQRTQDDIARRDLATFLPVVTGFAGTSVRTSALEALREEIDIIVNDREQKVDFNLIGPAKADGWRFDAASSPQVDPLRPPPKVVYRFTSNRRNLSDHTLEFILLDPREHPELTGPVYICTDEVSYLLFAQVTMEAETWATLRRFLSDTDPEIRDGPRTWMKTSPNATGLSRPTSWLRGEAQRDGNRLDYPEGFAPPGPPDMQHPMQYVSPQAAIYMAGLIGCRLPTTAEFHIAARIQFGPDGLRGAAQAAARGTPLSPLPNVRDRRFALQWDWAERLRAERPTANRFTPEVGAFSANMNDREVYNFDDGILWFERTDLPTGTTFRHLLGNVAEWVYDDPQGLMLENDPHRLGRPEDIDRKLQGDKLGIIGGSALSSPRTPPHEAQRLDLATFRNNQRKGFADVGFRLAMAPSGRFGSIAQHILRQSESAYVFRAPGIPGDNPGEQP